MATRTASARWDGSLQEGDGSMLLGSGAYEGPYSFRSRFEEGEGTNPEELIGAAHAGCFSMALAGVLERAAHPPERIQTEATVHLDKSDDGFRITRIDLRTRVAVQGIGEEHLREHAETAKEGCPVSHALAGVEISVAAELAD
jgi:osmotically inducible protein OsmC